VRTIEFPAILTSFLCVLVVGVSTPIASDAPDDLPFGKMREKDRDRLIELAKVHGVDVYEDMERVYQGDKVALAKVLGLSSLFNSMDAVTRVYGNLVFASFLNVGEAKGVDFFAEAVTSLRPEVRQRVRDFVYYAVTEVPERHRAEVEQEVRREYAAVFPSDYVFGKGNPLFD
jgi:hypothetical protein